MPSAAEDLKRQSQGLGPTGRLLLGVYLHGLLLLLIYLVACLWPIVTAKEPLPFTVFGWNMGILPPELAVMWAVGALGALGGSIHAAGSFVNYVGNRAFVRSWVWFYLARAPMGMGLSIVFFFAVRGGLFARSDADAINPYGMGALGALTGLFSEIATQKLREVFTILFRPAETRSDPLTGDAPRVLSVRPQRIAVGSRDIDLVLSGTGFEDSDVVTIGGRAVPSTFVSDTELRAKAPATRLGVPSTLEVSVRRGGPGGVGAGSVLIEVA